MKNFDASAITHQFGDHFWRPWPNPENPFTLMAREETLFFLHEIRVNSFGEVEYCFAWNTIIDPYLYKYIKGDGSDDNPMFWTKERTEEWIKQYFPKRLDITKPTKVFCVLEGIPRIYHDTICGLKVGSIRHNSPDGIFYVLKDHPFSQIPIDGLGVDFFFAYRDAKKAYPDYELIKK